METYMVLILIAGIIAMDTTSGPQILISEPFVSCSVVGLLFGAPETGLMLGILFQLLWLGYLPLGAVHFADSNMAGYISTASLLTAARLFNLEGTALNAALIPTVLFGVVISIIGLHMRNIERRMNGKRSDKLLSQFDNGTFSSVKWAHLAGVSTAFGKGILMAVIFVPVGTMLCGMVRYLPSLLLESMSCASLIIWGAVSASAVLFYWTKGKPKFLIAGSIGGFIWVLFRIV